MKTKNQAIKEFLNLLENLNRQGVLLESAPEEFKREFAACLRIAQRAAGAAKGKARE